MIRTEKALTLILLWKVFSLKSITSYCLQKIKARDTDEA